MAVLDGVFNAEVAVVECGWTSCSCVKKVSKMMTALDLHGRVADCLQADVADDSLFFSKYVHVSSLSYSNGGTAHATCRPRRETCGVRSLVPRRFPIESYVDKSMEKPVKSMLRDIERLSMDRSRCSRRELDLCDEERKTRLKN